MQFSFYEKLYLLDTEVRFPESKEKAGSFVGITENVGDALTYWVLTEDTEKVIARSVICRAEDPETQNKRLLIYF